MLTPYWYWKRNSLWSSSTHIYQCRYSSYTLNTDIFHCMHRDIRSTLIMKKIDVIFPRTDLCNISFESMFAAIHYHLTEMRIIPNMEIARFHIMLRYFDSIQLRSLEIVLQEQTCIRQDMLRLFNDLGFEIRDSIAFISLAIPLPLYRSQSHWRIYINFDSAIKQCLNMMFAGTLCPIICMPWARNTCKIPS